jgi:hypothetical protein
MPNPRAIYRAFAAAAVLVAAPPLNASDGDLVPPNLPQGQRANLLQFLRGQEKPDRFVPADAQVVDAPLAELPAEPAPGPGPARPVRQYLVQIISHRPVPDQENDRRVDVYYYRPNPEQGKPGITVKHTVDLTTGKQVGPTEVLVKHHTPISREELALAVELAREKSPAVAALYKDREKDAVRWEYLQVFIRRKHEPHEPGDRVVRFVFQARAGVDQAAPAPVPVVVNLTKGVVVAEAP